jgi:hypothetical protein
VKTSPSPNWSVISSKGIELAALAEQLRAAGIGLEFLSGELQRSHDPSGVVFTVLAALSGTERPQEPEPDPPGGHAWITGRKKRAAYVS